MTDAITFSKCRIKVLVSNQLNGPFEYRNLPTVVRKRLCQLIKGTNHSVTVDNWFTNMNLINSFYTDFKLTFFGNLQEIKIIACVLHPVVQFCQVYLRLKKKIFFSGLLYDDNIDKDTNKPKIIMK